MPGFWKLNESLSRASHKTGSAKTALPEPSRLTNFNRLLAPTRFRSKSKKPAPAPRLPRGHVVTYIQPPNLLISETVDEVIVHHADRLHVCINDGRTNEAESPGFKILAKRVRFT